jgi:putative ABC transport system substrate-binding protein
MAVVRPIAAFTLALTVGLLAAPLGIEAQRAGKVHRIGYLTVVRGPGLPAFEEALRERGWMVGENLVIDYRSAEERYDRLPGLAAELVRLQPHVIVAVPTASARAARNATSTIPIVMRGVADPIGEGLIASFARPGGNVTGITGSLTWATYAKQLQLLKEAVPRARRIALLWNPANRAALPGVEAVKEGARTLGIELQIVAAQAPEEFEPAFQAMIRARAEALLIWRDAAFFAHVGRLADLAVRHRLPTISGEGSYAQAGGLMTYAVNSADEVRQLASYVDRILRGADPAELPVAQPTKFDLVVNLKTAKALGISLPATLSLQAAQIIE